ncbi:MAG: hypothetical protein PHX78_09565 [bacterium]|nr:hypothetical protein [bacterium]
MNTEKKVKDLLANKFGIRKIDSFVNYLLSCVQKYEEGDWENSLINAGKFVEVIIKLIWIYCGKSLPTRAKDFKASVYADKITREVPAANVPEDAIRIQIPRACIFIYDITSNRGARHDSDEVNPNEMDATVVVSMCSWVVAELIRFSAKQLININEAKKIVDSLMERKYPFFEEIDERVYVDKGKFKSAPECAILILYKLYPRRINKETLIGFVKLHNFRPTAIKFERLNSYIDIDKKGEILLRATGRKKAEHILKRDSGG